MNYETEEGTVRIHKLLNNNAVIILDENNREVILTGRGIAYQKKVGDTVDEQKIEKRYTLNSPQANFEFFFVESFNIPKHQVWCVYA